MMAIANLDYSHVGHIGHSVALNNNYDPVDDTRRLRESIVLYNIVRLITL